MKMTLATVVIIAVAYLVGAKFPGIAQRLGLA